MAKHRLLSFIVLNIIQIITNGQLECNANVPCIISCGNCSNITINASESSQLTLNCNNQSSCQYSNILCPNNNQSICNVVCNGEHSCSDTTIHAQNSTTLNMKCTKNACRLSNVYGSKEVFNLECHGYYACTVYFYADYMGSTSNISVICNGTDGGHGCHGSKFYIQYAHYVYFKVFGYYDFTNVEIAGSYISEILSITVETPEFISASRVYCPINATCNIYQQYLQSLSLYIEDIVSADINVYCIDPPCEFPNGHTVNAVSRFICSGYPSYYPYPSITSNIGYNKNDNRYYCQDDGCCPDNFMITNKTVINCVDNEDCVMYCNLIEPQCEFAIINATKARSLSLWCDYYDSCQFSTVLCPNGNGSTCIVYCNVYSSIYGGSACSQAYIDIDYSNLDLSTSHLMELWCTSTKACSNTNLHAIINENDIININCDGQESCSPGYFYIEAVNTNVNDIKINCTHWMSCFNPELDENYIQSQIDIVNSSLSLLCSSSIYGYACNKMKVNATNGASLTIDCDDISSCEGLTAYCPMDSVDTCTINCADSHNACNDMNIIVSHQYIIDYLKLTCPSQPTANGICDNIKAYCNYPTNISFLIYDILNGLYLCDNDICCPWIPTKSPTSEPTNEPSIDPTIDPTGDPTEDPTKYPTIYPTMDPTSIPTFYPSGTPTFSPTTSPTGSPLSLAQLFDLYVNDNSQHYDIVYFTLVGIPIIATLCGLCCKYKLKSVGIKLKLLHTDHQDYISVLLYFLQILDMYSDLIFAIQLLHYYSFSSVTGDINTQTTERIYYLFILSLSFVIVPYILNYASSIRIIDKIVNDKIMNNETVNEYTKKYVEKNSKYYSIGVLLSGGSFYTLKLLNSNWMGFTQFQMGLSTLQIQQFAAHKFWCTTLLENIPQFCIQIYFIGELGIVTNIVIVALLSSIFNILLSIMSAIINRLTYKNQKQFGFTINLSWTVKSGINNNQHILIDPYKMVGNRSKLSHELTALNTLDDQLEFEILSSIKRYNSCTIYGVVKVDISYTNPEGKINSFFENPFMNKAIIKSFKYSPKYTQIYSFDINVSTGVATEVFISDKTRKYLPLMLEFINWNDMKQKYKTINDTIIEEITNEINSFDDDLQNDTESKLSTLIEMEQLK